MIYHYNVYDGLTQFLNDFFYVCHDDDIHVIKIRQCGVDKAVSNAVVKQKILARIARINGLSDTSLSYTDCLKPYFKHGDIKFNISHHGKYYSLTVSKKWQLGIDILAKSFKPRRMLSLAFSDEELALMRKKNEREQYDLTCRLWTVKEAVTKAMGHGMTYDFKALCLANVVDDLDKSSWQFQHHQQVYYLSSYISAETILTVAAMEVGHDI